MVCEIQLACCHCCQPNPNSWDDSVGRCYHFRRPFSTVRLQHRIRINRSQEWCRSRSAHFQTHFSVARKTNIDLVLIVRNRNILTMTVDLLRYNQHGCSLTNDVNKTNVFSKRNLTKGTFNLIGENKGFDARGYPLNIFFFYMHKLMEFLELE